MAYQWQDDRRPVGADRLTARYYRHRRLVKQRRQLFPPPWLYWQWFGPAEWMMLGFALLFGLAWLLADWWAPLLVPQAW